MPPKRKRHAALASEGLAPGESLKRHKLPTNSPWLWVGTEATNPSDITLEHLLISCGLSSRNSYKFCPNKYTSAPNHFLPETCRVLTSSKILEDDVIVVSDDEEAPCSKKQCRNNPNCLNYLGQDMWEDEASVAEAFVKAAKLGRNPALESRDPQIPVGLKNLGATCYANASLQVWFRDLAFRSCVYSCGPSEGMEEKFEESPIFQLQVAFAALQKGVQKVFNPTKFVESLKLNTFEQQDAQEFSKLFMSHLDSEFKKQSLPEVCSLITDQFQGQQCYATVCDTCHYCSERNNDFLEVEINFESNSTLEDRIAASLLPERLTGDNRYFCPQCNNLQDASRHVKLSHLPPVLHFSLLRFVYDLSTMERKKSKRTISFPETLNMDKFLGSQAEETQPTPSDEKNIYELRGILLHKGSSAYHGHYEAQIYDTMTQSWFQFNDEVVTNVTSLGDKTTQKRANDDTPSRKNRSSKKRPGVEDSEDEGDTKQPIQDIKSFASRDAYMLIYSRKEPKTEQPTPPDKALDVVNNINKAHDLACKSFCDREAAIRCAAGEMRKKVKEIYSTWNVASSSEDSIVVNHDALKAWILEHCTEIALRDANNTEEQIISNSDILCQHGLLDPDKAREMKRIARRAYDSIRCKTFCAFDPPVIPSQVCRECVETKFKERLYETQHPLIVKKFDEICKNDSDTFKEYWISKRWLKDWKLQKPKMHTPAQDDPPPDSDKNMVCEHGGLALEESERRKIPQEAVDLLQQLFPLWQPVAFDAPVCDICNETSHISREAKKELRKQAEDEKAKLKRLYDTLSFETVIDFDPTPAAILPSDFAKSWKKWLNRPTIQDRPGAIDNSHFLCEHGQLIFDPNSATDVDSSMVIIKRAEWDMLETLYPAGPLISLEPAVREESTPRYTHPIPVCAECRMRRKTEWETTEITILFGRQQNHVSDNKPLVVYTSNKSGARQSKRLRQMKEYGKRRKITVAKSTTVKDIKNKIYAELQILTILQKITYQGKELKNDSATVAKLGILANDVLEVEEENETMDVTSDSDSELRRKRRREEGAGFSGTLLGGGMGEFSSGSGPSTPHSISEGKDCPACTFCNAYDAQTCTICDTLLI